MKWLGTSWIGQVDRPGHIPWMSREMTEVEIMSLFRNPSSNAPMVISVARSRNKYNLPQKLEHTSVSNSWEFSQFPFGNSPYFSPSDLRKILELNLQEDNPLTFYVFPQWGNTGNLFIFTNTQVSGSFLNKYNSWKRAQDTQNEN